MALVLERPHIHWVYPQGLLSSMIHEGAGDVNPFLGLGIESPLCGQGFGAVLCESRESDPVASGLPPSPALGIVEPAWSR